MCEKCGCKQKFNITTEQAIEMVGIPNLPIQYEQVYHSPDIEQLEKLAKYGYHKHPMPDQ